MESFEELAAQVADGIHAFRRRHPYPFLVRKPRSLFAGHAEEGGDLQLDYNTEVVKCDSDGLMPWQWCIVSVKKKPDNPFPEHISVGRATNCDVVLRFPYVSKLHARFLLAGGIPRAVVDCGSANGLLLNGDRLEAHRETPISAGDRLKFGNLVVDYLDAEGLFEVLRARRPSLRSPTR